eukprot:jgi/Mesvir1/4653/Mv03468-RA.1
MNAVSATLIRSVRVSSASISSKKVADRALKSAWQSMALHMSATAKAGENVGHKIGSKHRVPNLVLSDHWFDVPIDHSGKIPGRINLYVREVVSAENESKELPYLLFLQGGPGFEAGRPTESSGWIKQAVKDYRVLLMDQRGTGLSSPLSVAAICKFGSPAQQAEHLRLFRQDSIVRDAELVRAALLPKGDPWAILGQSYGGFCCVTYLSMFPEALSMVLITGGLPPTDDGCTADAVYRALYHRVLTQNKKYYERFPQDIPVVQGIVQHLASQKDAPGVALPSGGILTPEYFQLLGLSSLGSSAGFETLHYLLEKAWDSDVYFKGEKQLSLAFLRQVESTLRFDTNPLYAILHEAIYCQRASSASKFSAERIRNEFAADFDAVAAAQAGRPVNFTGEMTYPWMYDQMAALRPIKEAAEMLANVDDWSPIYNDEVLRRNTVPVAAAVYFEDLYVDFNLSQATVSKIQGIRTFVTNQYLHSGLRDDGAAIFERLTGMLKGQLLLN